MLILTDSAAGRLVLFLNSVPTTYHESAASGLLCPIEPAQVAIGHCQCRQRAGSAVLSRSQARLRVLRRFKNVRVFNRFGGDRRKAQATSATSALRTPPFHASKNASSLRVPFRTFVDGRSMRARCCRTARCSPAPAGFALYMHASSPNVLSRT